MNRTNDKNITANEILSILWNKKIFISLFILFATILTIIYSISLPNIYTSSALLVSANNDKSSASMLTQYRGLASIGGISLPNQSSDKSVEAIERMQTFDFFSNFFIPAISLQNLVAVKGWESSTNTIIYDSNIFNAGEFEWVGPSKNSDTNIPSLQDSYEIYSNILSISQDKKTSLVY